MYYFIFLTTFITTSSLCAFADFVLPHLRLYKKKIEDPYKDYIRMLPIVIRNLVISYPVFYFIENYLCITKNIKQNIYNYHTITYLILWMFLADIFLYIVHRLFHTKQLYFLHKTHHEFSNPYGIGSIYCSITEMVCSNILALLLPIYMIDIPENMILCMIGGMTFWTVFMSHGCFQEFNQSHIIHHRKFNCNYGLFITDRIMGTKENKM